MFISVEDKKYIAESIANTTTSIKGLIKLHAQNREIISSLVDTLNSQTNIMLLLTERIEQLEANHNVLQ